jgi:opacity protein-like surface antigen
MRYAFLAAVAAAAIAAPAYARDNAPYLQVDAGIAFANGRDLDVTVSNNGANAHYAPGLEVGFKTGWEADGVIGYDFGFIRAEAELAYKHAGIDRLDGPLVDDFDVDNGHVGVLSGMANVLFDFGDENGFSFYGGGGIGLAKVKMLEDSDSAFAWQLIAGVRYAVSRDFDIGLKYRYFQAGKVELLENQAPVLGVDDVSGKAKFSSHSILLGLTYNFGGGAHEEEEWSAPPPPPPPPPPPAMQHCPDGSVIPVNYPCPEPPPPPEEKKAGERGR